MQSAECSQASSCDAPLEISSELLIQLFDQLFVPQWRTCLRGGALEPIYLPASAGQPLHQIHFTQDYCASALHEIAHWCVAGTKRLSLVDFGYWYAPDGRSQAQQVQFEQVEIKPQALEWIFSVAAGLRFRVSADNLAQGIGASSAFKRAVTQQAQNYCQQGLPTRAAQWVASLADFFKVSDPLNSQHYCYEFLGDELC